jgi:hypothetical protein
MRISIGIVLFEDPKMRIFSRKYGVEGESPPKDLVMETKFYFSLRGHSVLVFI